MVSMAKVLITQQRICNFRYHCLAQLQVVKTMIWESQSYRNLYLLESCDTEWLHLCY